MSFINRTLSQSILMAVSSAAFLTACSNIQRSPQVGDVQASQSQLTQLSAEEEVARLHPHEGSGIVGSAEMIRLTEQWETMNRSAAKQQGRERFSENKYGMFIHWGLYSQVGGVWKGERVDDAGKGPKVAEWVMRRKEIPRAEYRQLAKTFNPTQFDAKEWVAIAKAAGMKYLVITAKHHDGFALFASEASDYNVVDATPFGRDIIRELEQACKEAGLSFGVYYSNSLDWYDGGDGGWADYKKAYYPDKLKLFVNNFDPSPISFDDYVKNKAIPQVNELVNHYDLTQIWFDTPLYIPPKHSMAFYKEVYNGNPQILVSQRIGNGFGDIGTPGDNVIPDDVSANTWEGIATTNNSWGFKSYDNDWKSPIETLFWLVENVSKGGNFLLNVGPDGRGKIPAKSVENLLAVGDWLKVNGEAVYGSKPWKISHEGPTNITFKGTHDRAAGGSAFNFTDEDFWFTRIDDAVYTIALSRPDRQKALITSFQGEEVTAVTLLGSDAVLNWQQTAAGLAVDLPEFAQQGIGYTLKVSLK